MKKWRADDFWFEMASRPDGSGHMTRYYLIKCRTCGTENSLHNNGLSAEPLKKHFQRQGWDIGKTRAQHLCPDCQVKKHNPPPETLAQQLFALWQRAGNHERYGFLQMLANGDWRKEFIMLLEEIGLYHQLPDNFFDFDEEAIARYLIDVLGLELSERVRQQVELLLENKSSAKANDAVPALQQAPPDNVVPIHPAVEIDDEPADWWKEMKQSLAGSKPA